MTAISLVVAIYRIIHDISVDLLQPATTGFSLGIIPGADNHTITVSDDEQKPPLVTILGIIGQRIDSFLQWLFSFCITWNLTNKKLVVVLWRPGRTEIDRCQELERNDRDHRDRESK